MLIAHGGLIGGFHAEYLLYAGALLVVAVALFVRKDVNRIVPVALVLAAIVLVATSRGEGGAPTIDAAITLVSPGDGDTVAAGEPVTLTVDLGGDAALGHMQGGGGGHVHVLIDGATATMSSSLRPRVTFEAGDHTLVVEYVDTEHRSFSPPVRDEARVTAE